MRDGIVTDTAAPFPDFRTESSTMRTPFPICAAAVATGIALGGVAAPPLAFAHGDAGPGHSVPAEAAGQQPFGIAGDPGKVSRTIDVDMTDAMRFTPAAIRIEAGDTVRFRVHNRGQVMHEMVLGTTAEFSEHQARMREQPAMAHDAAYVAHVEPGATAEIVWTFNRPGSFDYACLVAGHFEAGMVGRITVAPRPA